MRMVDGKGVKALSYTISHRLGLCSCLSLFCYDFIGMFDMRVYILLGQYAFEPFFSKQLQTRNKNFD